MTNKNSSTPLTLEAFDEKIMPRLEKIMEVYKSDSDVKYNKLENKFVNLESRQQNLENKVDEYKADVVGMKAEVLFEVQKLRQEVTIATHQYIRTNKRVDLIDKHLGIVTSDLA